MLAVKNNMDNEIIILQEIKSTLWVLVYLVGIGVTFNIIRAVAASYRTIKAELNNKFYTLATAMFEIEDYDGLIEYCHKHLKKKPKEAYAYWFLGKAHFHLKEYDKSSKNFKKAAEIYPNWEKEWVSPYLEKIDAAKTANKSFNQIGAKDAPPG